MGMRRRSFDVFLIIAMLCLGPVVASADLGDHLYRLSKRGQRSLLNQNNWRGSNPSEYQRCRQTYQRMFRDGVLRLNINLGYLDDNQRLMNRTQFSEVYSALQRSCYHSDDKACGFKRIVGSRHGRRAVFQRSLRANLGNGVKTYKVRVALTDSSPYSYDSEAFDGGRINRKQRRYTKLAERDFYGSLAKGSAACDVCVYFGHARDGGGPDFGPVPYSLRLRNGKPNYDRYRALAPGYRKLLRALTKSKGSAPSMVALFGCYTKRHFWKRRKCLYNKPGCAPTSLSAFSGETAFLMSRELSWPQNRDYTLGALLDSVLNLKCGSALRSNLKRLRGLHPTESFGVYGRFL